MMTESTRGAARLSTAMSVARNTLIGALIAIGSLIGGQYSGASAVASALQLERMDAWAARSPAHAAALASYLACEKTQADKEACVNRAATGTMGMELHDVTAPPKAAWKAAPRPLRWLVN